MPIHLSEIANSASETRSENFSHLVVLESICYRTTLKTTDIRGQYAWMDENKLVGKLLATIAFEHVLKTSSRRLGTIHHMSELFKTDKYNNMHAMRLIRINLSSALCCNFAAYVSQKREKTLKL